MEDAMALPSADQVKTWQGRMIVDESGASIGACVQVYADDATGLPEWARARMGTAESVLPLLDAVEEGDQVRTTVSRDAVLLAPAVADEDRISPDEEVSLYRHYGIAYSRERSPSLLPTGESPEPPADAAPTDAAPTTDSAPTDSAPTDSGHLVDEALQVAEDLQPEPVSRWRLITAAVAAAVSAAAVVVVVLSGRRQRRVGHRELPRMGRTGRSGRRRV